MSLSISLDRTKSVPISQPNSGDGAAQYSLTAKEAAGRLGVALSTLNSWLKEDQLRPADAQLFKFHRWVGNRRVWSEEGYRLLEAAIHAESEDGVLSANRSRPMSPEDPDADASLASVLNLKATRTL